MKRIIVNADDFGITASVNAAVIDAFRAGSLSSTTLLVNGAAAADAAALAQTYSRLGVGLHFNLTLGAPSAPRERVASLLKADGVFPDRDELARRVLYRRLRSDEVRTELCAQLNAFAALGLTPTHVDSHQHVHAFPRIFDVVADECRQRGLPLRQPVVLHLPSRRPSLGRRLRSALLAWMNRRNAAHWNGRVRMNGAFASVFDFGAVPAALQAQHYGELLRHADGDPLELMVHVVRDAGDVEGLTRIGTVAAAEWEFLRSGALAAVLAEHRLQLCTYAQAFEEP